MQIEKQLACRSPLACFQARRSPRLAHRGALPENPAAEAGAGANASADADVLKLALLEVGRDTEKALLDVLA
jgi:hypothetical protein